MRIFHIYIYNVRKLNKLAYEGIEVFSFQKWLKCVVFNRIYLKMIIFLLYYSAQTRRDQDRGGCISVIAKVENGGQRE